MWDGEKISVMIQQYWEIEETHKILQKETGDVVPLSEVVDLEMQDGMIWEWKWRDPSAIRSTPDPHAWSLEDQSLFSSLYRPTDPFEIPDSTDGYSIDA